MLGYNNFFYGSDNHLMCDNIKISDIIRDIDSAAYIYSAQHLRQQYQSFQAYFPDALVAFAVKSCPNIAILKLLGALGCGADIVSAGEMRRALKANIPAEKIMFSGVGKTADEIKFALDNNIGVINVESAAELEHIAQIAEGMNKIAPISLRINPDVHTETLRGISTGKRGDKFGIPQKQCLPLYQKYYHHKHLDFKGIDFHIGSQVLNVDNFAKAFAKIRTLIQTLRKEGFTVSHLDCGGGLGVPYNPDQSPPDIQQYAKIVQEYFGDLEVKLAFEPGRFIAANAGILVSKVLYTKSEEADIQGPEWNCLVIDAAMNDLARPAIYGAYHHIIPVVQDIHRPHISYDIVGPVCESTDTFCKNFSLQQLGQGEYLAILSAGAYGASMRSNYNSRLDIPEILVDDGGWKIIRKQQSYEEMFGLEVY